MKNTFISLAMCLVLSSCLTTPTAPQFDSCTEKQQVADAFKIKFKRIAELATSPTENDVRDLAKVLPPNFRLDEAQCQGYTKQIRDASKEAIRKRASEITPTLLQICSMVTDPEIIDVSLMVAMQEERIGAKEALIILHESTDNCLP